MNHELTVATLDNRELDTVCGGQLARYLAKGALAGGLFVAPVVASTVAKDDGTAAMVTGAVTWGSLAGWAAHSLIKARRGL